MSIKIPDGAEVLINASDFVEIGDKLFNTNNSSEIVINLATELKINPAKVFKYLQKLIGETVEKEEIVAKKKGLLKTKSVRSPQRGVVKSVDHLSGDITIISNTRDRSNTTSPNLVRSFFSGLIKNIDTGFIQIEIAKAINYEARDISGDGGGELFFFTDESVYFKTNEYQINKKIVVIKELKPHIQVKCEALGCVGFVILKGELDSELPTVILSRKSDYDKIVELKKKHILFTVFDRLCTIYD